MLKNRIIKSLILFLLLSQFVTLAHAFEHDSMHADDEQCFVCIHKTNFGNALVDSHTPVNINPAAFEKAHYQNWIISLTTFSQYNNRSPPKSL